MDDLEVTKDTSSEHATSIEGFILGDGSSQRCIGCQCLKRQVKRLCYLRNIEQSENPIKLDVLLACTKHVVSAAEATAQCAQCQGDSQALFVTVMSFHMIFRWVKIFCQSPHTPCIDLTMKLGHYEVPSQEAQLVKHLLLSQAIARISKVASTLSAETDHMVSAKSNEDLWEFERVHLRALQYSVRSLPQTSSMLSKKLGQPPKNV